MNNKAIKILKENNLFDKKENKNIKTNNFTEFLKTYSFSKEISSLPKGLNRDDYGYLLLDEIPYIESNIDISKINKNMHNNCTWILLNNGSKILLKEDDNELLIPELLLMYFLNSLDLDCAIFDGTILDNKKYIISPSFLKYDEIIFDPLTVPGDLIQSYEDCKKYNFGDFYLKTVFADYIYGNPDRFPGNFGLIKNKKNIYKTCPLFDNAEVALLRNSRCYPYINGDNSIDKVINYLLNYDVIINWIKTTVKNANLNNCAEKVSYEKGFYVPQDIYRQCEFFFKDSEAIINDELKNKGVNLKIKLT